MDREIKNKKSPTIVDIAKETGLSIATVSKVINNVGNHQYSEKTKKIIEDAIKKLNYTPNLIARSLKNKKTHIIGFVVPELDEFYTEIFLGAQYKAQESGYSIFLCDTNYNKKLEEIHSSNLISKRVDGVIFTTGLLNNKIIYRFIDKGIPVVLIEKFIDDPEIPTVYLDNYRYTKLAIKHLIENGYKRISFISAPLEMHTLKERFRGYKDVFKEHGMELDESLVHFNKILRGEWDLNRSFDFINSIMKGNSHPDALFILSDNVCMIALKVIKKLGYKIPEDIGVMGFDDRRICQFLTPSLSSVYQPKYEMGKKGTELLMDLIHGKKLKERNVYLDMKLSIRESSNR